MPLVVHKIRLRLGATADIDLVSPNGTETHIVGNESVADDIRAAPRTKEAILAVLTAHGLADAIPEGRI